MLAERGTQSLAAGTPTGCGKLLAAGACCSASTVALPSRPIQGAIAAIVQSLSLHHSNTDLTHSTSFPISSTCRSRALWASAAVMILSSRTQHQRNLSAVADDIFSDKIRNQDSEVPATWAADFPGSAAERGVLIR